MGTLTRRLRLPRKWPTSIGKEDSILFHRCTTPPKRSPRGCGSKAGRSCSWKRRTPAGVEPWETAWPSLRALLEAEVEELSLVPVVDPEAAAKCHEAGEGKQIRVELGHKLDPKWGQPVTVEGVVERLSRRALPFTRVESGALNGARWDRRQCFGSARCRCSLPRTLRMNGLMNSFVR